VYIVQAIATLNLFQKIRHIHQQVNDTHDASTLISKFSSQGKPFEEIQKLYDQYVSHDQPNVYVLTAMIKACLKSNRPEKVVHFLDEMGKYSIVPDRVTVGGLMSMCKRTKNLQVARRTLDILKNLPTDYVNNITCTNLIKVFNEQQDLNSALSVLDLMSKRGVTPDAGTYLMLFKSCVMPNALKHGGLEGGRRVHAHLQKHCGKWDLAVQNAVLRMYTKHDDTRSAAKLFESLDTWDSVGWTMMINCYSQNNSSLEALQLFDAMKKRGLKIDSITYTCVIKVCADLADLSRGKEVHTEIVQQNVPLTIALQTALIDMYGKCRELGTALKLFGRYFTHKNLFLKRT
jgi:pentatricopeptide repeat protein